MMKSYDGALMNKCCGYDIVLLITIVLFITGCTNFGPKTVAQDRVGYNQALSDSWKEQMLHNMVKLRYGDAPIFLDVSSVINSYELSGRADLGGNFQFSPTSGSDGSLGISGTYANRPTITYSPLSGEKFARSLMAPIPSMSVINLIQSGYPADLVFRVLVQSVNGIRNKYEGATAAGARESQFNQLAEKMKRIQAAGAMGLKLLKENGEIYPLLVFASDTDETTVAEITDVKKMLGLDPQAQEYRIVHGVIQTDNKEIAILSRSVLQVMAYLASYIEVPEIHVREKRAKPNINDVLGGAGERNPPIVIHSSSEIPGDAFFAVFYHQYWFWIDDKDMSSKSLFSFLMFVFTLVESGGKEGSPIVTVPVR